MAVHPLHAVRGAEAAEAVPLDDAGEAAALAGPVTSTRLIPLKSSTVRVWPSVDVGRSGLADLADVSLGLGVDLPGMAALGLGGALPLLVVEAQLHGMIAVALLGPDQEHGARAAFQDGDRHRVPSSW